MAKFVPIVISKAVLPGVSLCFRKSGPLFRPRRQIQPPQIYLSSRALNRKKERRNPYYQLVASTSFFSPFSDLDHGKIGKSGGAGIDGGAGIRVTTSYTGYSYIVIYRHGITQGTDTTWDHIG